MSSTINRHIMLYFYPLLYGYRFTVFKKAISVFDKVCSKIVDWTGRNQMIHYKLKLTMTLFLWAQHESLFIFQHTDIHLFFLTISFVYDIRLLNLYWSVCTMHTLTSFHPHLCLSYMAYTYVTSEIKYKVLIVLMVATISLLNQS